MRTMNEFKRFDVISDDSDHHFRHQTHNLPGNTNNSIMKEWKTLEPNQPESIYVQVYEQRIDLMRVVIIGATGTPYRDSLFFFDIAFPSDYPNNLLRVHFTSFRLQLNPNLYTNVHVCLSLLNTWLGNKIEKWDPSMSTCLQLLFSLQALVLNEKPYFNEAFIGIFCHYLFDGFSREYSQHMCRLACQLALHLIRMPPKNFDVVVECHFRDSAEAILTAFVEYVTGRMSVGYYGAHAKSCSPPRKVSVSRGYKRWLQDFYPSMINAFENCGASLDTSVASWCCCPIPRARRRVQS